MKEIIINNIKCKIGSNALENWDLLDNSKENHIFFHLSSFPSCYVILEIEEDKNIDENIFFEAALLCKNNTKYKNLKNIKIDYCRCSNLVKGDKLGEVIYKSNRKVKHIQI
jgi:predicted ribosome quality control (RQC) complex YloA/Tae2 family protein